MIQRKGNHNTLLVAVQTGTVIMEFRMEMFKNMNTIYNLAILVLDIYPNNTITLNLKKNIYTLIFMAALFIIAKLWKQPKCPSIYEWINNMYLFSKVKLFHFQQHE